MTDNATFSLLARRRFLPLFATQFLGALNDNLFKNALTILILYRLAEQGGANGQILVTLAGGIFILPFFLFSATAGQLADRYDKSSLIRLVKLLEIALMALAAWGFHQGDVWLLMGVLFGMGVHSTFFGPLKYAILPSHLAENELLGGNALVEAGTFLAILGGTLAGGLLILTASGIAVTSAAVVGIAVAGFVAALFVPRAPAPDPGLRIDWNIARETASIVRHASRNRPVFLSILGISWFWLMGATLLSQFPALARDVLGADETVVTVFLVVFSVGVGAGSILCSRLLKGEITAKHVPFAALGMSVFAIDLFAATAAAVPAAAPIDAAAFLAAPASWRILADLFLLAVCGGLFSIPLYAILQARSDPAHRSRTIAANNVVNALLMVVAAVVTVGLLWAGFTVPDVILTAGIANLAVAIYICGLLPREIFRTAFRWYFRTFHAAEIRGLENYAKAGERVVIVANHQSFLDGCLLAAFLPGDPTFAVDTQITRAWWASPFLAPIDVFPVDPANPYATKSMIHAVREGRKLVIFPEGRITTTGSIMKVYEGPGMIADKADAMVLPIRLEGLQFTPFSRMHGKLRLRWFPKFTMTILPPRAFKADPELRGRQRRRAVGTMMQDLMSEVAFQTQDTGRTLFQALLDARHRYGAGTPVFEDIERQPLTYGRLVLGSLALGRKLSRFGAPGERVGVLLPNSLGAVVTFFGLQAHGRVPAMLNFSAGAESMLAACRAAQVTTVLTSSRFIERAKLGTVAEALSRHVRLVPLEEVRTTIGLLDKLRAAVCARFPRLLGPVAADPGAPAVVLFTSGSEGLPKGVALSHANILANCAQVASVVDFNPSDRVLNAMPMFHSFGLTAGTLLPLFAGVRTFLYPSPLHYKIVPEMIYGTNATIAFGTDTFLAGYARVAHPYDFYAVRYIFAGAEKVKDETRRTYMEKFGVRVMEGYGATETSPVLALNTAMHYRAGTVGRLLPGIEHRLEPVPGIETGGRLLVRGPNVMAGYYRAEAPGVLQPPEDGWYDTGDIVAIDGTGFVTIQGRAKRFAKVAGEMVSLAAVEAWIADTWKDAAHAVVAIPDARKGEQLVLVTTRGGTDRREVLDAARERRVAELMVPRTVLMVERMPLLGTGKTDHPAVQKLVAERLAAAPQALEAGGAE